LEKKPDVGHPRRAFFDAFLTPTAVAAVAVTIRHKPVMLHGNFSRKYSDYNGLLLLKCHGRVAEKRLCDSSESWSSSLGRVLDGRGSQQSLSPTMLPVGSTGASLKRKAGYPFCPSLIAFS
jgi:hypothetical protein